ncbi:GNAT family N-acetyltransferase [Alteromonas sp. ASW11-19]|uniref:GNAT family N-acetyltransferase n=1 Tax=Alteromonas salexigens TaxID=2982530 RepID=A0ABT2VQP0_9ALTE|nr:GNAT family N-acetyltransferase [Alteromonas salexigens]MCU7555631.1 GNAT family N-acetyltransferase [Alteromonas salexigens]
MLPDNLKIVPRRQIDDAQWDTYVDKHAEATPYHRSGWLNAVVSAYEHDDASIVVVEPSAGTIMGVFPCIKMNMPLGKSKYCALPYCDVGYGLADNAQLLGAMETYLLQLAKVTKRSWEIRKSAHAYEHDTASLEGKKVRMLLALAEDSESLLASFKSKLRSQIRKAEKNGLRVETGRSAELLEHFYSVYSINMRDLGSPVHAKRWFERIVEYYGTSAVISVTYKDQLPIGAGLILKSGETACIPWASTNQRYNRLAPNMLLYWSLLAHCADNGIRQFDFGRSTYNEGTYRFKKQWGASPVALNWQHTNEDFTLQPVTSAVAGNSTTRELVENIWRKLPLAFTIKAGATIRPYISL